MKVFIKGLDITHGKDTIKLEELNVEVNYKELLECIQELGVLNLDNSEQVEQMQDINSKMEDLLEAIKTDDFSKVESNY